MPNVMRTTEARVELPDGTSFTATDVWIEAETEFARSDRAVMADMAWQYRHDTHVHQWVGADPRRAEVSEARRGWKHVDCDGSCGGVCGGEGYDTQVWLCVHDDSELDPRYVPDLVARDSGIPIFVTVNYTLALPFVGEKIDGASLTRADGTTMPLPMLRSGEWSFSANDAAPLVRYTGSEHRPVG